MTVSEFKEFMSVHKLTQRDAAEALNVSPATICRVIAKGGTEDIGDHLSKAAMMFLIRKAHDLISAGVDDIEKMLDKLEMMGTL